MLFNTVKATLGFDRIKFMVTGSAPISDECLIALRVIFGVPVIQGLGLSETGGGICPACAGKVREIGEPVCKKCGKPLSDGAQDPSQF